MQLPHHGWQLLAMAVVGEGGIQGLQYSKFCQMFLVRKFFRVIQQCGKGTLMDLHSPGLWDPAGTNQYIQTLPICRPLYFQTRGFCSYLVKRKQQPASKGQLLLSYCPATAQLWPSYGPATLQLQPSYCSATAQLHQKMDLDILTTLSWTILKT